MVLSDYYCCLPLFSQPQVSLLPIPGKSCLAGVDCTVLPVPLHPQSLSHALGIERGPGPPTGGISPLRLPFPGPFPPHPEPEELQPPLFVVFVPKFPLHNSKSIHNQQQFINLLSFYIFTVIICSYPFFVLYQFIFYALKGFRLSLFGKHCKHSVHFFLCLRMNRHYIGTLKVIF